MNIFVPQNLKNILKPDTKDPRVQRLYDYLTQYFPPKQRKPSGSAEVLTDEPEVDADAAEPEADGETEIEEAPAVCLHDVYAVDPLNGDNEAVVAREKEHLCWSLGGGRKDQPTPEQDFEALQVDKAQAPAANPDPSAMSVEEKIAFLETLNSKQLYNEGRLVWMLSSLTSLSFRLLIFNNCYHGSFQLLYSICLRQKMKERRLAILAKKLESTPAAAGPTDETLPFEATQACQDMRMQPSPTQLGNREDVETPKLESKQECQNTDGEKPTVEKKVEVGTETKPETTVESCDADSPGETGTPRYVEGRLAGPPVLAGCLDKNFKCPQVVLVDDINTLVAMGLTEQQAEDALAYARGRLSHAINSYLEKGVPSPKVSSPCARSPTASELMADAEPVSRAEQAEARQEIQNKCDDAEEGEHEEDDEKPVIKKKPRGKAKAKAKAKAKGRAKAKSKPSGGSAKEKPAPKKRGRKPKESEEKTTPGNNDEAKESKSKKAKVEDAGDTKKAPRTRKAKAEESTENQGGKKKQQKVIETPTENEKKCFAKRYIPKSEPLRSLWIAARSSFEGIKDKFTSSSKLEDWEYHKESCQFQSILFKNMFTTLKCNSLIFQSINAVCYGDFLGGSILQLLRCTCPWCGCECKILSIPCWWLGEIVSWSWLC